jgi:hypothetical protein
LKFQWKEILCRAVYVHVKMELEGLSHQGMTLLQVANGGDCLQRWRVAADTLNKQSRTGERGWSFSLRVGRLANNSSPRKETVCYEMLHRNEPSGSIKGG